jgi:hypothetical protein
MTSSSEQQYWSSPTYTAHLIMTNYCVIAGYQFIRPRKHRRLLVGKERLLDLAVVVGYRYDYFWRHYPGIGNLEFDTGDNIYGKWYKKVPVCGAINFTVGNLF